MNVYVNTVCLSDGCVKYIHNDGRVIAMKEALLCYVDTWHTHNKDILYRYILLYTIISIRRYSFANNGNNIFVNKTIVDNRIIQYDAYINLCDMNHVCYKIHDFDTMVI